jgi:DNA repair exonuclease SbcCD ATPase subunit
MAKTKAKLEDDIAERDRRIAELRRELDEARDLIQRQDEQLQDVDALLENWKEAFKMVLGDDGLWTVAPYFSEAEQYHDRYVALVREWNKNVAVFNATVVKRNVGRPLAASEAQIKNVRQLHRRGVSLRGIAEETSLGLRTVRTILDQQDGTDRTSIKHLQRIDPDRARERVWQAKRQMRKALPRRIAAVEKANVALRKEAKGLK